MITRMWEARLADGASAEDVAAALPAGAEERAAALPGGAEERAAVLPAGAEVYLSYDGPPRLVVISHWPDEAALSAYAGPAWRTDPGPEATAVGDRLAGVPHVWHFTRL